MWRRRLFYDQGKMNWEALALPLGNHTTPCARHRRRSSRLLVQWADRSQPDVPPQKNGDGRPFPTLIQTCRARGSFPKTYAPVHTYTPHVCSIYTYVYSYVILIITIH